MTHRYFVQLSYDGNPFHGWQIQNNAKTIQQSLNEALSTVTRCEISTIGCGRTDTGVHAREFYAHFDMVDVINDLAQTTYQINSLLPREIAVQRIFAVDPSLHARFSAVSRTYEYLICSSKNPFAVNRQWEMRENLDLEKMQQGAHRLMQHRDFTSFTKHHGDQENFICEVSLTKWDTTQDGYKFTIRANRFLRNMVRAIVGTLVEVGKGSLSLEAFDAIISAKNRSEAGLSVPAHGLYLTKVEYPEGSLE